MPIRHATPADVPCIRALEQQAETAAHWSAREYEALFASDAPQRVALVATAESDLHQPHGFLVARRALDEWEIENVVVAAGQRRQGIGSALVRSFLREAASLGAASALLEVRESNMAARQLYENAGFKQVGRRLGYYSNPPEDALLFKISIAVL